MIFVYKFASGSCDGTNMFGHSAIAFNGLDHKKCFAISQMGEQGTSPTWHNSEALLEEVPERWAPDSKQTASWRRNFFSKRVGHAFPLVWDKAIIISNEDLILLGKNLPKSGGASEEQAFQWWQGVLRSTGVMWEALGASDCSDTVFQAIQACLVNPDYYPSQRTLDRPFKTPQAAVDYARDINAEIIRETGVTRDAVRELFRYHRNNFKMWWPGKSKELLLDEPDDFWPQENHITDPEILANYMMLK